MHIYASMQECKYANIKVCTYMQVWKYASMHVYASMQVFKHASMQACKYAVCKTTNTKYASMLV